MFAITKAVNCCNIGITVIAKDSNTSPSIFFNMSSCPAKVFPAASADPPNSFCNSSRITVCAAATSPASTIDLIMFFCSSVKVTPTLVKADIPAIGSFKALPSATD